jgi:hypothetical protein
MLTETHAREKTKATCKCKTISSSITISKSEFKNNVNFSNLLFEKPIKFERNTFRGHADFIRATFSDDACFYHTNFRGDVNFRKATFSGEAKFQLARFGGDANFTGHAGFREATFRGHARFFGATFSGEANFRFANFDSYAEFREATFSDKADFHEATFSKDALFEDAYFEKELDLTFTKYKRLFIRWKNISKPRHNWELLENWNKSCIIQYRDTTYLSLIENLKSLGFFDDADNCYYDYRIERRKTLPNPIYKFFDWLLFLFYGYGVRPLRPLAGLVFLIIAFGLLYPYLGFAGESTSAQFNTSLIVSLSGTKLIDNPIQPATSMLYWAFSIEKLLASLFFAMILVSIGRTVIR